MDRQGLEPERPPATYQLTRFLMLRLLGLVYLCAFLAAAFQAIPLIGHDGLLPADSYLHRIAEALGSPTAGFERLPSLFWLNISDPALAVAAWVGVALSALLLAGFGNAITLTLLWALYMSFVHVGQLWYGYGWEIQLLETGFLAIFLVPPLDLRPFSRKPAPLAVIWLYRWLAVRIMLGAGLIKLRGDPCWRDLTCLYYHYQTQPIPNPISPVLHFMPRWFQKLGVLYNHFAELVCPVMALGPRPFRRVAGLGMALFQLFLIASGNLSFLNWLTLVPIVACLDDALLEKLLPAGLRARIPAAHALSRGRRGVSWALAALIGLLSIAPVANLISPEQRMNSSFGALDLVNTYGAFGTVGRQRDEIIFEGTADPNPGPDSRWLPYEFKCKPGDPDRRPCWMSPYHYRLDWQIWFAAMTTPDHAPWTLHFVWKLLHGDPGTLSLLAANPFPAAPPRFIRAQLYRYELAPLGARAWWRRTLLGPWLPPLSADSPELRQALQDYGWLPGGAPTADPNDDDG